MEASGLIVRRRGEDDERQVFVSLSRAGRELRQKAESVPVGVFCAAGCSLDELIAIKKQLDGLRQRLAEAA